MVLLTSSAVSAALSAGIVCIFTFLLFLSGYVLQQQTVRSLQEAIRNPPEKPWFPKPTLPPQFLEDNDTITPVSIENELTQAVSGQESLLSQDGRQGQDRTGSIATDKAQDPDEPSPLQLWHDYVAKSRSGAQPKKEMQVDNNESNDIIQAVRHHGKTGQHAYILTIPSTTDLCSVVVFTRWYRQLSKVSPRANIVFIYPATWEMSASPIHTGAMELIREMQDKHGVICHPVSISRIYTGVSVESQLLAELQHTRWTYDRAMYFRSPGMALDINALDQALISSTLKTSWQGLSSKSTTLTPSLLLYVYENGLLAPRAGMRKLTVMAAASDELANAESSMDEARHAAYVIFDEKDLQHRRRSGFPSSGLFERFERERRNACTSTAILARYDLEDTIYE